MKQSFPLCLIFSISMLLSVAASAQSVPVFRAQPTPWADSVIARMDLDAKIGQLFMVAAYSNRGPAHQKELEELVEKYKIGGLIFFQGGPVRQAKMTNHLQSLADIPLLIGMDAEWGLAMRLDSTLKFPRQMVLGALSNDSLIYAMGAEIARQGRRLGVHVNFAPVVDINNNPANPVIGSRSFGEDREMVTRKSAAYIRGMQDHQMLANAKHFPGHGDTDVDSHYALPRIKHSRERMESIEMYPYRYLIPQGLGSIMVAHLSIPALDSTPGLPSTLSSKIVDELLTDQFGFEGLIFTDALNMKGVADYLAPGKVDLAALQAGNDVLLFAEDVPVAARMIKEALAEGTYSEEQLNRSVYKILAAKEWTGAYRATPIEIKNLIADLNTPEGKFLNQKIAEGAITLLQNKKDILPLKKLDERKIAVVTVGGKGEPFVNHLSRYCTFEVFPSVAAPSAQQAAAIANQIAAHNTVIVYIDRTNHNPSRNFGLSQSAVHLAESLAKNKEVILVHMGSPYALEKLSDPERFAAIVIGYQDEPDLARAAAGALMGTTPITGTLPVSIGSDFPVHYGMKIAEAVRLHYTSPLEFGYPADAFALVDSIAFDGMAKRAYPGAQILVAKNGHVIYDKTFGSHTYDEQNEVKPTDLYDLASITKIAATTISLMRLDDLGKFDLDAPLHHYLPELDSLGPYFSLQPRRMLAHVAGLKPWVPFFNSTMSKGRLRADIYSSEASAAYPVAVAHKMFATKFIADSIMAQLLATPLLDSHEYKYSDLGYFFLRNVIERITHTRIDTFTTQTFYAPLGLTTMGYLPLDRFPLDRLTPTEYDRSFRNQLVHGYVHDPAAAMLGGLGGHAGLFSNARDLAVLMQMLINQGTYGGERYLSKRVIEEYTRCQFCKDENDKNRRGAGFDKPVMPPGPGPTCKCVTFDSFGHSGFTGTLVWADPVENIVFVFLSNRVYPTAENNRLARMNIRTNIQTEIYRVLAPENIRDTADLGN